MSSVDSTDSMDASEAQASEASMESMESREDRLNTEDMEAAEREVDQYLKEERASTNTNLLEYWEVRHYFYLAVIFKHRASTADII